MEIRVDSKVLGQGHPVFIVAECGTNHNGSLQIALDMVDRAAQAGVDAVKFQPVEPRASYVEGSEAYQIYSKVWLDLDDWVEIRKRAEALGLVFFAAPADLPGVEMMRRVGLPLIKISSPSMTNVPLQDAVSRLGVPVMVSTGMSYIGEVESVVRNLASKAVRDIVLLHCVSIYPSPWECLNLRAMETMMKIFPYPVGYSDHSLGNSACLAAVALGATVIEKHFTLDKKMEGPEHGFSADIADLRNLVQEIRNVEKALGSPVKQPCDLEKEKREQYRRCLVANGDIARGTVITADMVGLKRPIGKRGLETEFYYDVIGKVASRDIQKDEAIGFEHLAVTGP